MQSNPVVVDGVLYATTPTMQVVAVDAATGAEIWNFDPSGGAGAAHALPPSRRGRARRSRASSPIATSCSRSTRRPASRFASFGANGRVDLREGLGKPAEGAERQRQHARRGLRGPADPAGSSVPETLPGTPGHIRAFDVKTGKQRWIFHTIPQPGEFGYDTWPTDAYQLAGGANAWAGVTRRSRRSAWCSPPPARRRSTSTARRARATTCSPTACSRSTRAPASACGTSRA